MSRLILVRHAQASFTTDRERGFDDYDRLSPLGVEQSGILGDELAASGARVERVYVGPARRHRHTADLVGEAFLRNEVPWPAPVTLEGLAEHDGAGVVGRALASPAFASDRELLQAVETRGGDATDLQRAFFEVFRRVTRMWAREELDGELVEESWAGFRARVRAALDGVLAEAGRGSTVAVFTSGGPVASTVADVLGLNDERALELAWVVQNATLTELLSSDGRVSLKSFNVQPRLGSPELSTYV